MGYKSFFWYDFFRKQKEDSNNEYFKGKWIKKGV